VALVQALLAY